MQITRVVIVGNGVAGTLAAEAIRKEAPAVSVTVLAREPYPLYNRVALPRLLRGEIGEARVFMRSQADHHQKGFELKTETVVERVDPVERVVYTQSGDVYPFDRLLVATGGRPNRLHVPGVEPGVRGIHYFQSLDDTKILIEDLATARRAVTVGGSYIAYELTEGLRQRGLQVTWLIRGPHFLRRVLDADGGRLVDQIARGHGVDVVYGEEVARVQVAAGQVRGVVTTSGRAVDAELVACGLGLTLNTELLAGSGVAVGRGVLTDEYLETNVPGIFAAGDVAEFHDTFIARPHVMGTWDNASTQGRVAAANMLGARRPYVEVPSYTSTLFDSTLYVLGMTTEDRPDLESLSWLDLEGRQYRRLFFLEDRLVGAVMIGDRRGRRILKEMIRSRERITLARRAELLHESGG